MTPRAQELRLLAPLVLAYLCLLGAVAGAAAVIEGVALPSLGDLPEHLIIVVSAVGIWMTAAWVALCGKNVLLRSMYAALLIGAAAWAGVFEYASLQGGRFFERHFEVMLYIILMCATGFFAVCAVPLLATRWLLGWRILLNPEREGASVVVGYSVKSIFWLTTAAAVGCTALTWATDALSLAPLGGFYIAAAVVLAAGGLLQLLVLSRVPMRLVWPVSFLLGVIVSVGAIVSGAVVLQFGYSVSVRPAGSNAIWPVALPMLCCYAVATLLVLVAASYLRRQGVLVRCGGATGFGAWREPNAMPSSGGEGSVGAAES